MYHNHTQDFALQEKILPGQRLNYAFDFQHFDTGQLSQIIYLHNPLHKPIAPPVTLEQWDKDHSAGPLAAFAQLHPFLQERFARTLFARYL